MAYTPTYTATDVAPITFDVIGAFGAALVGQMGPLAQLIILLVILGVIGGIVTIAKSLLTAVQGLGSHRR